MGMADDVERLEAALRQETLHQMASRNGMSKSELSRLSGISTSSMSRLLPKREGARTDRWTVGVIKQVAEAFGMTASEFLDRAEYRAEHGKGRED
jgi:transcriptional regulator with XRE-family HTH domain